MTGRLEGKVAVVTGGAVGIGRAYAQRLAAEGARVGVLDVADSAETVQSIPSEAARGYRVDLTEPEAVLEAVQAVERDFGGVDVLVNNAGIYPPTPFVEITMEQWRRMFAVNVDSMFSTVQAAVPKMTARGWGRIINVTSNSVGLLVPGLAHYVASKMAVIGLTRGAATELAPLGITVNAIGPSLVRTPNGTSPEYLYDVIPQMQAIKRAEVPEDLVGIVAFLASDDSAFITAQTFWVDGGLIRS